MFQGAIVTFVGYPMENNRVVEHVSKELATMHIAWMLDVGETIEINGNSYTIEKRALKIETDGAVGKSEINAVLKYGASQRYTVFLEPKRLPGLL
jgi:hypothetical protein